MATDFGNNHPFINRLMPGEEILWMGRPDPRRIFNQDDRSLLFVLMMVGVVVFLCNLVSSMQDASFFQMLGLFFLLFTLYIGGRLAYKAWLKHGIRYAVTNQRILILNTRSDDGPYTLRVNHLPPMIKTGGFDGVGTIMFGQPHSRHRKKNSIPADPFLSGHPGFYDIHNVHEVYSILNKLQSAPDRKGVDEREFNLRRTPTAADYEDRFGPLP